jgi:hypothetical protein
MFRDHMTELKQLLAKLLTIPSLNINYHGWVSKNILSDAWKFADVWFYPCIYPETFCLTALEAAVSKTLVVTNDLAALINTVGDRGVVIKGDVTTEEWQDAALTELFNILNNHSKKTELIQSNYEWASGLSWESRAFDFIQLLE